jgi:23S rRNA pseudouridine1911/1915/1917 synthase
MAHIGHPLIGDATYGSGYFTKAATLPEELAGAVRRFRRQALHAGLLGFEHPRTGEALRFVSAPPADLADLIERFRDHTV